MTDDLTYSAGLFETETDLGSGRHLETAEVRVPALTLLYHPELERVGERAVLSALGAGVAPLSRMEPVFGAPGGDRHHPLAISRLSRTPILLRRESASGDLMVERNQSRTSVLVHGTPLEERHHLPANTLEEGVVLLLGGEAVLLLHLLDPMAAAAPPAHGLLGTSSAMVRLRAGIDRVGPLDVPVLVRGSTGTGKELVARALHHTSPRSAGPFVAVNMAAIPPSLAAAELFGARKGAFTGADQPREGYFRQAEHGTLFLDEIGEAPVEVQALLLRALETGEIRPLGSDRAYTTDVRLVAATDADLETAIADGAFRAPLLHRLAGFSLRTPSLAARRDDIGRLFLHFLRRELDALGAAEHLATGPRPWVPATVVARLAGHPWPGNVRQLQNVVRQLVIAYHDAPRLPHHPPELDELLGEGPPASTHPAPPAASPPTPRRPADIREEELLAALRRNRFRPRAAAAQLGIPPSSLYELMKKNPRVRQASELDREEIEAALEQAGGSIERLADLLEVSERALRRRMGQLAIPG